MSNSTEMRCFSCSGGIYELVTMDYSIENSEGDTKVVPKIPVHLCSSCGDESIPVESAKLVHDFLARDAESLEMGEVAAIFEAFGMDQTRASEAYGFGAKTLTRWLNGKGRPNRTMSIYLRILSEFPAIRNWVEQKAWAKPPTTCVETTHTVADFEFSGPSVSRIRVTKHSASRTNYPILMRETQVR